ncbi:MAG: PilZ domain-containing protein [Candidatus Omnitrophica bacterium]|jgi:hypothetical protein|nr:PilZ domain-containing protein [Candidatus Omnitrophota bacterium]
MAQGSEDNRCFPRIRLQAPLRIQARGSSDFSNTLTNNISLGGLGFSSERFIAPNTLLMLQFNLLSRVLSPLAKVAWVNSVPRADKYSCGVEFMEFDNSEKKYLRDYLDMKSGKL